MLGPPPFSAWPRTVAPTPDDFRAALREQAPSATLEALVKEQPFKVALGALDELRSLTPAKRDRWARYVLVMYFEMRSQLTTIRTSERNAWLALRDEVLPGTLRRRGHPVERPRGLDALRFRLTYDLLRTTLPKLAPAARAPFVERMLDVQLRPQERAGIHGDKRRGEERWKALREVLARHAGITVSTFEEQVTKVAFETLRARSPGHEGGLLLALREFEMLSGNGSVAEAASRLAETHFPDRVRVIRRPDEASAVHAAAFAPTGGRKNK